MAVEGKMRRSCDERAQGRRRCERRDRRGKWDLRIEWRNEDEDEKERCERRNRKGKWDLRTEWRKKDEDGKGRCERTKGSSEDQVTRKRKCERWRCEERVTKVSQKRRQEFMYKLKGFARCWRSYWGCHCQWLCLLLWWSLNLSFFPSSFSFLFYSFSCLPLLHLLFFWRKGREERE